MMCREAGARHLRFYAIGLTALLVLQVVLGVEAWMGKFGTGKPVAPEARTVAEAFLRTGHSLVGASFLAFLVVAWIRGLRPALAPRELSPSGVV